MFGLVRGIGLLSLCTGRSSASLQCEPAGYAVRVIRSLYMRKEASLHALVGSFLFFFYLQSLQDARCVIRSLFVCVCRCSYVR